MKLSLKRLMLVALAPLLVGAVLGVWLNRPVSGEGEAGSPAAGLRQLAGRIEAARARPAGATSSNAPTVIHWASLGDDDYLKYLTELKRIGCPLRTLRVIIEGDVDHLYRPQLAEASGPYWAHSVRARRDVVLKKAELIAFLFAHVEGRDLGQFRPTDSVEGIVETHALLARHLVRDCRDGAQARDLTEDLEQETLEALSRHLDAKGIQEYRRRNSIAARQLREQLRRFAPTDAEFRAIFAAVDQPKSAGPVPLVPGPDSRPIPLSEALGAVRYEEYRLTRETGYSGIVSLVDEFALPPETIAAYFKLQREVMANPGRIHSPSGGYDTRFIADTQARLKAILGPSYPAYVERYRWLMPHGMFGRR
jgi:hypothetical protein